MKLVLMGPPGAGKGTQGELLERRLDAVRYSTGDMLREARRNGTGLGQQAQSYMDAGELVPDPIIIGVVGEALAALPADASVIFDGFPRTIPQAEGLDRILEDAGQELDAVVNLVVPEDELVARLSSRRVCLECGAPAPADGGSDGTCATCGGTLGQRTDDMPETVRRRLRVYYDETAPVLEWYAAAPVELLQIDGTGRVDEIQARIRERLPQ
jgi:adenylate kinase